MKLPDLKIYLSLGGIALFSWILVKLTGIEIAGPDLIPSHSPDFFSIGYAKREMDESGQLKNKLTADIMIHYGDDGTIYLKKPLMYFYNDSTPPWMIRSETGLLSADGIDLFLNGAVSVERAQSESARPVTIHTSNVKVKPKISHAETNEWAELISASNKTAGTGMKMVFSEPIHLEFLTNVKGTYESK